MAVDTPRNWGIMVSSSATLVEIELRSPSLTTCRFPSSDFCVRVVFLTVSCSRLDTTSLAPVVDLNDSFTSASTSFSLHNYGN
jgi:hypothetical protein